MSKKAPEWDVEDGGEAENPAPAATQAAPPVVVVEKPSTPKPEEVAAPVVVVVDDKFPTDLKGAFALLAELSPFHRLPTDASEELKAKQAKYYRLRKYVHTLQQGLPVEHTNAESVGAFNGLTLTERTRWVHKARTDLDFKKLLAAHDALVEKNTELETLLKTA